MAIGERGFKRPAAPLAHPALQPFEHGSCAMRQNGSLLLVLATVGLGLALHGCNRSAPPAPAEKTSRPGAEATALGDHSGWWCAEHGVPEEVCALCNARVAAEFQRKGDWCKEHNRPQSQCFVCDPKLEARFAAQYEARFGKKPPRRPETSH